MYLTSPVLLKEFWYLTKMAILYSYAGDLFQFASSRGKNKQIQWVIKKRFPSPKSLQCTSAMWERNKESAS